MKNILHNIGTAATIAAGIITLTIWLGISGVLFYAVIYTAITGHQIIQITP